MAVANTLAFYDTATIMSVKCFTVQAPDASCSSWTQTLNLEKMGQVFYHCVTAAGHVNET
jgi:hypothetical protein